MTCPHQARLLAILLACWLAAGPGVAQADTTSTTTAAIGTSATTETRLAAEFADFLGGREQAATVVAGLRQGTAFDLVAETAATGTTGASTTTTTIDPPTGSMGYGNVRITLRLAQAELAKLGITAPTPEELSAILVGGEINGTPVTGILALRAEGMGWGRIARQYGMTVGQIMGKGAGLAKTAGKPTATASAADRIGGTQARANGYIPSGKAQGSGIVTGAGNSVQVGSPGKGGQGGTASAASQQGQAAKVTHAGGASAAAPGQVKKN